MTGHTPWRDIKSGTQPSNRVRPFSCGSQYADWMASNCHGCRLYNPDKFDGACELAARSEAE